MEVLLDPEAVTRGLRRVAGEIVERHPGTEALLLVGIRRGGVPVARELARWVRELEGRELPLGTVDITLYRDDAATALPNPRIGPSEIPGTLEGRVVVLCDDVLFTGRTVRAAIDALLDYGRPRRIELAALIDRGGRELPIRPDYVVRSIELPPDQRVDVIEDSDGLRAVVQPQGSPSVPPPRIEP
jgi:pyrimidine operon attenuation protein / uracil phosphoribosyltransferase